MGFPKASDRFQNAIAQAEENFGVSLQPAQFGAEGGDGTDRDGAGQDGTDAVRHLITAVGRDEMQGPAAVGSGAGIDATGTVGALKNPAVGAGLEPAIGDPVVAVHEDLDVVDQCLARTEHQGLQLVRGRHAGMGQREGAGGFDRRPGGTAGFIPVAPEIRIAGRCLKVDTFQRTTAARGQEVNAGSCDVGEVVLHREVSNVGNRPRGRVDNDGAEKGEPFTAVAQCAVEIADHRCGSKVGVKLAKAGEIPGNRKEFARFQKGSWRELERDTTIDPPVAQVNDLGRAVVDFDEFVVGIIVQRFEVEFAEHHVWTVRRSVARAGGRDLDRGPMCRGVHNATDTEPGDDPGIPDRIEDAESIGGKQEQAAALGRKERWDRSMTATRSPSGP